MPISTDAALHHDWRGHGPRLVLAHGFTQTGRLWGGLDGHLATDHRVAPVDMPGHGASGSVRTSLVDGALGLVEVGGKATYLGYSMGARFCLHVALARPDAVDALVLISGTAGIDDDAERRRRKEADQALADRLDPPDGSPELPVPVADFLSEWTSQPMFSHLPRDVDGMVERMRNTGAGLASSLRLAGTGTQRPLWTLLDRLSMPVLIITGENDTKFTDLGERMTAAIGPHAEHLIVSGAGHAPHLERPAVVEAMVRSRLARWRA
jgi:2-succinyl-6-hydroxy-2,4-cyclohexadiene-1-carboxylate synthase